MVSVFTQPFGAVTFTVYIVEAFVVAMGLGIVALLNWEEGNHW